MKKILAVDPGTTDSAFVVFDGKKVLEFGKIKNEDFLSRLTLGEFGAIEIFCEMIASYGMPVGAEVFETCVWIGRFQQAHTGEFNAVYRKDVKLHLCGSARAKDGNVRASILDRYGGKAKGIGRKACPGPLYGLSGDVWQALAVGITAWETKILTPKSLQV